MQCNGFVRLNVAPLEEATKLLFIMASTLRISNEEVSSAFREVYIEIPLKLRSNNEERRDVMVFLKHRILEKLVLKLTKKERVADLALSTKTVQVTTSIDSLDIGEYETYKTLFRRSREQLDSVHDGTLMKNYFLMFPMIVLLRQVVDHHYYGSLTELASGNKEAGDVEQACDLCQDAVEDPVFTSCSHVFCKACLIDFVESMGRMACPSCTEPLTFDFTANNDNGDSNSEPTVKGFSSSSILNKIHRNEFKTSTKLEALVFLMDSWWNPAVEQQAQDRIHRIWQHKPVKIIRFVIEDTIEEKILELQERKKLLFEGQDSRWFSRGLRKANRSGLGITVLLIIKSYRVCKKDSHCNAPWPIGVSYYGWKLLHSVRRLVTFCQRRYPTMPLPSNSVKFNSLANDSDLHSLRAREQCNGFARLNVAPLEEAIKLLFIMVPKWRNAHYIQSVDSNATKAVLALESTYKWALTGAHLQIEVLYSLVRFLRADPYAYYFCEDCDGKGLDFRFSNPMCPHNCARYFHWWKKYIEIPVKPRYDEEGRDAMVLLNHRILKNIMLERTKKERVADLALPTKTVRTRKVSLDTDEYKTYKSLFRRSREQFYSVHAGTLMKNYFHMFATIVRLRQVVDHPYLVACGNKEAGDVEQACDLCQDAVEDPVVTSCSHVFCKACLIDFAESTERMACPSCTEPLTFEFTVNNDKGDSNSEPTGKGFSSSSISKKNQLNEFKTSTKLEALKEEISIMVERDGSAKGVVFSQFTSFLDLIQRSLNLSGVNCVQLVGSISITARDAAVDKFNKDSDCRILLMSLKDGGIALDVKVVSHVFIMDTWWNPAVEQQAQDRIRRIGQQKPVKIVRFMTKNTIEEKILELQEEKKLRFEGQDSWWFFKGLWKAKREGLEIPS
ncbi:hypothetical protein MTR67_031926 [Solanum verrucosum]|uniref:Uncharacterized protein n=1 Tax=Solanum verrucosum TaxID=315347 RepID=A0AAF0U3F0_SOLVR|nr:hypothetical protein MTR67_031926 [Solanum verrucosum]